MTPPLGATCWCGSDELVPAPHAAYATCRRCGSASLVELLEAGPEAMRARLRALYGRSYWHEHQTAHSMPAIDERARHDLGERCAYWLSFVVRYRGAPADVLEVGCGHGGLLKLLAMCGYRACGIEVDAEVARFGREQFGAEVRSGQLEEVAESLGQYDCVLLLDVLEHFAEPDAALGLVARHLRPDGVLVVQTPCHRPGLPADWPMYFPPEHTVLFSQDAARALLARHGLDHVAVEPALFPYDMFLFASRAPLQPAAAGEARAHLERRPDGRVALALVEAAAQHRETLAALGELRQQVEALRDRAAASEEQIAALQRRIAELDDYSQELWGTRWLRLGRWLGVAGGEPPRAS